MEKLTGSLILDNDWQKSGGVFLLDKFDSFLTESTAFVIFASDAIAAVAERLFSQTFAVELETTRITTITAKTIEFRC